MYSTFVTSLHILANAFIGLRSDVTNRLKLPCILVSYCIKLKLRCQPYEKGRSIKERPFVLCDYFYAHTFVFLLYLILITHL